MGARHQRFDLRFDAGGDRFEELRFFGAGQAAEFRAGFGGEPHGEVNFFARCGVKGRLNILAGGRGGCLKRAIPGAARIAVTKSDYRSSQEFHLCRSFILRRARELSSHLLADFALPVELAF